MAGDESIVGMTRHAVPAADAAAVREFPELPCLRCGVEDTPSVNLKDLSFYCSECDYETPLADARDYLNKLVAGWRRVFDWIALAPPITD